MRSRRRYTDRRQAYTTGAMIQRRRARARHRNLDKEDNSISGMRWVEDLFRGSSRDRLRGGSSREDEGRDKHEC